MILTSINRRAWRWYGPGVVVVAIVLGFLFYRDMIGTRRNSIRHLSSSGAYAVFQDSQRLLSGLGGRAGADGTPLEADVTVVTGFLFEDAHSKDSVDFGDPYTRWMEWSKLFRNMSNPVIAYLGSVQYMFYFESIRGRRAITRTNMTIVNLSELSLSKLRPKIEATLAKSDLGISIDKIMHLHAKYELLQHAARLNPFRTTHMIYLDPRDYTQSYPNDHTYKVLIPDSFDVTRVAYRTFNKYEATSVDQVFREKRTYVEGDFLMGATETIVQWTQSYLSAFSSYLDMGYLGTDESTIYAMIADSQKTYKDMVNTYPAGEPGFATWFQKMSGSRKPTTSQALKKLRKRALDFGS